MHQHIGECTSLTEFLTKIEGLEIDGIAVVVMSEGDYMSFQFNMNEGDMVISSHL